MIIVTKLEQQTPSFTVRITKMAKKPDGFPVEVVEAEYQISPENQRSIVARKQADLEKEQEILTKMEELLSS